MNTEFFIARRIVKNSQANFSAPIVRIAIISIALGLAVMIISLAIVSGFQKQIRNKVIGFGSHIRITKFDSNKSYEAMPISKTQDFYPGIEKTKGIKSIQVFALKAGIIKTKDQIQGVVFKGIGSDFDWSFFEDKIEEGKKFSVSDTTKSNKVMISRQLASLLKLKLGDDLRMYFIIENELQPRGRKFEISGIYKTGLEEFDMLYVIGDIGHIQKLNQWDQDQVGGFEIFIDDFNDLDIIRDIVYNTIPYDLNSNSIQDLHPEIFDWLELQDMNVIIILILMLLVASITMISTLLILILDRTYMIGVLKALGAKDSGIRKIFLYNAIYIIGIGLLWGNIFAIALCLLQYHFGIINLNQESYYVSVVPINLSILHIFYINLGTLLICTLMLIIPSFIITKISPVKAIRFS
ncbi:MAG: ABC transporter permease [Bacteroidales bacterium]|nr:ABC transporter permease [Bacteroidales bacterium]